MSLDHFTDKDFDNIVGGMSLQDVEKILGGQGMENDSSHFSKPPFSLEIVDVRYWTLGDSAIAVAFNKETKMVEASVMRGPPISGPPINLGSPKQLKILNNPEW